MSILILFSNKYNITSSWNNSNDNDSNNDGDNKGDS